MRRGAAVVAALVVVALLTTAGCGGSSSNTQTGTLNTQTGTLTGMEASFDFSGALKGSLDNVSPSGRVIITKDNGEEVKAFVPKDMWDSLVGGQTLEIVKMEDTDEWLVSKILKQP